MPLVDAEAGPAPEDAPKKASFVGSIFTTLSSPKAAEATGQPHQQRSFLRLSFLDKIPPRWRPVVLIGIIMLSITFIVLTSVLSLVLARQNHPRAAPTFTPVRPPSYPLAVKNPYLSAWLPGKDALDLPSSNAEFWRGQKLGWSVMARVDDQVYSLFGVSSPLPAVEPAVVTGAEYTSTRTTFNLQAGTVKFTLDFLSPIFPGVDDASLSQQSLPLSFLSVSAQPSGGQPDINIYSDIDHSWLGTDSPADFSLTKASSGTTHMWSWESTAADRTYKEKDNMARWGQMVYSSQAQSGIAMTMGFGKRDETRASFINKKKLSTLDNAVPTWGGSGIPVSGIAHELGKVTKVTNVTFGIAMVRDKAVQFYGKDQTYYYRAKYPKSEQTVDAVADAFGALNATIESCNNLDTKVHDDSMKIGDQNYTDITTLSMRQVFGALDVTIPLDSKDTSKASVWVKEISSNGDIQTLDIIYPAAPLFYWLSPGYIRLMIRPVAIYLEVGKWPYEYAVHDLGDRAHEGGGYPKAVGHDNGKSESMPLESTGNLLILAYMYYKATTNRQMATTFANNHKALFSKYANYLKNHGTEPTEQLSTNDGAGPLKLQTNLAIKAAVGLNAYGHMYSDVSAQNAAKVMASQIMNKEHGLSSDSSHLTLEYKKDDSWSVMFNLYPDVLLGMNTFPASAIAMQSAYYKKLNEQAHATGGIGLQIDSRGSYGSSNWMSFAGASAPRNARSDVGELFINDIHQYLTNGRNVIPFCDRYFVKGPDVGLASPKNNAFRARPVVGGHFAFLARGV